MKTDYYPKGWLRILDLAGMVIAPISVSFPFFYWAIQIYLNASSTGTNYKDTIIGFFVAMGMLLMLIYLFGPCIKRYVYHQATRDDLIAFRVVYIGLILASLVLDFMIFYAFFFRSKP